MNIFHAITFTSLTLSLTNRGTVWGMQTPNNDTGVSKGKTALLQKLRFQRGMLVVAPFGKATNTLVKEDLSEAKGYWAKSDEGDSQKSSKKGSSANDAISEEVVGKGGSIPVSVEEMEEKERILQKADEILIHNAPTPETYTDETFGEIKAHNLLPNMLKAQKDSPKETHSDPGKNTSQPLNTKPLRIGPIYSQWSIHENNLPHNNANPNDKASLSNPFETPTNVGPSNVDSFNEVLKAHMDGKEKKIGSKLEINYLEKKDKIYEEEKRNDFETYQNPIMDQTMKKSLGQINDHDEHAKDNDKEVVDFMEFLAEHEAASKKESPSSYLQQNIGSQNKPNFFVHITTEGLAQRLAHAKNEWVAYFKKKIGLREQ